MLSDLITKVPWHTLGLPNNLNIRISLHAAPVHVVTDPILRLKNYTGVHTSRAARIEPITPPGSVYCTQAFAAISEMLGVQSYECTYVGNVPLAKKYGMQPVFAVRWKSSSRSVPRTLHKRMREKLKKLALKVRKPGKASKTAAAGASSAAASKA
jgi:class 3 adenylate cyclase